MQRGLVLDCICSVNMEHFSLLQGHFWIEEFSFMIFFVLVFFQDEVEQLSSWKFLKWNRFGYRISPPKCIH